MHLLIIIGLFFRCGWKEICLKSLEIIYTRIKIHFFTTYAFLLQDQLTGESRERSQKFLVA